MKRSANSAVEKTRNSTSMHSEGMGRDADGKYRLDGMYRASDIGVQVKKQWRATLASRTRDSHRLLDSETIDLDATFGNGLKYPRQPRGALYEICNCRCRFRYVTPYTNQKTRSTRQGEVTGSYKKDSSFRGTKSIEIENMSYAEWMEWRKRNGN